MQQRINLTEGSIVKKLIALALPVMGTSFIQMGYNLIDMMCIGRVGSDALAAVGTAGFFSWLGIALALMTKVGTEVMVAQNIGAENTRQVKQCAIAALQATIVLAIAYTLFLIIFRSSLIGFFRLPSADIIEMAQTYLIVIALGMIFSFLNPLFTAVFNGLGNSKIPFFFNTTGLVFNILFDIILIFGVGPFPALGVLGAAIATVSGQFLVTLCFIIAFWMSKEDYLKINPLQSPNWHNIRLICRIGLPTALQECLFSIFSMCIGRIITIWGSTGIAVQKVGSQIEALSWMTSGGFATALSAFVGQNYGGEKYERIQRGYYITMMMAIILGLTTSILFIFNGESLFQLFIPKDKLAIEEGSIYLRILGYSQLFMCLEITAAGAFNGLGKTYIPATVGIILTGIRVPIAYFLSMPDRLGMQGVWWTISISSIAKGLVLVALYTYLKTHKKLY